MKKKIVAGLAMLYALAAWAAVDVNKASDVELEGLKGVGPALSKRIIEARGETAFKDWPDFMNRVKGVKDKTAAKLSAEGLTIDGKPFEGEAGEAKAHGAAAADHANASANAPANAPASAPAKAHAIAPATAPAPVTMPTPAHASPTPAAAKAGAAPAASGSAAPGSAKPASATTPKPAAAVEKPTAKP